MENRIDVLAKKKRFEDSKSVIRSHQSKTLRNTNTIKHGPLYKKRGE